MKLQAASHRVVKGVSDSRHLGEMRQVVLCDIDSAISHISYTWEPSYPYVTSMCGTDVGVMVIAPTCALHASGMMRSVLEKVLLLDFNAVLY